MSKKKPLVEFICQQCYIHEWRIPWTAKRKYCSPKCSSDAIKGRIALNKGMSAWNKGKTYEECFGADRAREIKKKIAHYGADNWNHKNPNMNWCGANNHYIKKIMKELNISYEEYLNLRGDKKQYYMDVDYITKTQPIHTLLNYDKRGPTGCSGSYQLDHKYPIASGFKNNIPTHWIGNIDNLHFIPWEENKQKNANIIEDYCFNILNKIKKREYATII